MGVETALAATGLAATVGTTAMSFIGASKERKKQREAERAAEKAMAEARKQLSINYFDQVAIKKEPYELQREALLSQGALAIQAGVESERGGAATAGIVQMAQNEAQAGIRTEMGKEMSAIELQSLEEQSRLRDLNTQLTLEEVAGQQQRAEDARAAAAAANQQGVEGIISGVQQGIAMIPLFSGDGENDFNNEVAMTAAQRPQSFSMKPQVSNSPNQFPVKQQANPYMGYYDDFMNTNSGKFGTNFSGVGGF